MKKTAIFLLFIFLFSSGFIVDAAEKFFERHLIEFYGELNKGRDLDIKKILAMYDDNLVMRWKADEDSEEEFLAHVTQNFLSIKNYNKEISYLKTTMKILAIRVPDYLIRFDLKVVGPEGDIAFIRVYEAFTLKGRKILNWRHIRESELPPDYMPPSQM